MTWVDDYDKFDAIAWMPHNSRMIKCHNRDLQLQVHWTLNLTNHGMAHDRILKTHTTNGMNVRDTEASIAAWLILSSYDANHQHNPAAVWMFHGQPCSYGCSSVRDTGASITAGLSSNITGHLLSIQNNSTIIVIVLWNFGADSSWDNVVMLKWHFSTREFQH